MRRRPAGSAQFGGWPSRRVGAGEEEEGEGGKRGRDCLGRVSCKDRWRERGRERVLVDERGQTRAGFWVSTCQRLENWPLPSWPAPAPWPGPARESPPDRPPTTGLPAHALTTLPGRHRPPGRHTDPNATKQQQEDQFAIQLEGRPSSDLFVWCGGWSGSESASCGVSRLGGRGRPSARIEEGCAYLVRAEGA